MACKVPHGEERRWKLLDDPNLRRTGSPNVYASIDCDSS